jgi:purine-nucleoside phosphorylase
MIENKKIIMNKIIEVPEVAIILGSGLAYFTDFFEDQIKIDYGELADFPTSTVLGHKNEFVFGRYKKKKILGMRGRFHYYEGYSVKDITKAIYLFKEIGVKNVIITNAAGGINLNYSPGEIVAIKDILNLAFNNPLIGENRDEYGPRFPDMSKVIDDKWLKRVENKLNNEGEKLNKGTYAWFTGPSFETKSEIKMAKYLGADMVGMSTVPEIISAKHCSLNLIAFSCITNFACGIKNKPLNHEEVIKTAKKAEEKFKRIIEISLEEM